MERPSLFPRPGGCSNDGAPREEGGDSAVEPRFFVFSTAGPVWAKLPVSTTAAAKARESWRSAAARPCALWGAAAAAVAAVAGMASMAASRSAFLRHKNASVVGSRAGNRKVAVPTCKMVLFSFSVNR